MTKREYKYHSEPIAKRLFRRCMQEHYAKRGKELTRAWMLINKSAAHLEQLMSNKGNENDYNGDAIIYAEGEIINN